jgi:glycosyltransferase involved in cell wall biosynthesis
LYRPSETIRVVFIVGSASSTSIPVEVAEHLDQGWIDLTVVPYYGAAPTGHLNPERFAPLFARGSFDLRAWRSLYRLLRQIRPDVIHVNHTVPALVGALLGRLLRVPLVVVTEHHDHRDISRLRALVNLTTQILVDTVICNSDYTCSSFAWWETIFSGRKRITIYNGVDMDAVQKGGSARVAVRGQLGISDDILLIGNVARLVREKDQETLIRAVAEVRRENKRVHLVIVGDGPLRAKLESLARDLDMSDCVTFTGEVQRTQVYQILHAIDIFVMSSTTEGFGNSVVEAMTAGKPVVVTQAGALPEVVGTNGWLVPPRMPGAITNAINEIAELPPKEITVITEAARQRVAHCFTVQRTAREYETLYRRRLAGQEAIRAIHP